MTSEFESLKHRDPSVENEYSEQEGSISNSFELLSAYIDDELSPSDKKQVQTWLDCDPQFKQLYIQLLNLQGQIQNFVVPPNKTSTKEISDRVFQSIDRSRSQKRRLVLGSSAIAASIIATFSGLFGSFSSLSPNMAKVNSPHNASKSVMLAVAVDRPAINIPKSVTGYHQPNSER